jgi:hypothetical protein
MGELLAVTCDGCGGPMIPNVSTLDDDGCAWICIDPRCPDCHAEELEAGDLIEAGVPEYLAGRLAVLLDFYEEQRRVEWCVGAGETAGGGMNGGAGRKRCAGRYADVETAVLLSRVDALGRRLRAARTACREAGEIAEALDRGLVVSYMSPSFDTGEATKCSLAVIAYTCAMLGTLLDALQSDFDDVAGDGLVGLRRADEL